MVQVILKYFDQVLALGASRITWEVCHLHNSCTSGNSDSESIRSIGNHALNNEYIIKHNNTLYPKHERGIRASKDTPSLINYVKIRSVPRRCRYGCVQKRCIPQKLPGQKWHMIHIYIYIYYDEMINRWWIWGAIFRQTLISKDATEACNDWAFLCRTFREKMNDQWMKMFAEFPFNPMSVDLDSCWCCPFCLLDKLYGGNHGWMACRDTPHFATFKSWVVLSSRRATFNFRWLWFFIWCFCHLCTVLSTRRHGGTWGCGVQHELQILGIFGAAKHRLRKDRSGAVSNAAKAVGTCWSYRIKTPSRHSSCLVNLWRWPGQISQTRSCSGGQRPVDPHIFKRSVDSLRGLATIRLSQVQVGELRSSWGAPTCTRGWGQGRCQIEHWQDCKPL